LAEAAVATAMKKETLVVVVLCSRYTAFFEKRVPFWNLFYIHRTSVLEKMYSLGISTTYIHTSGLDTSLESYIHRTSV
jgi:hypothetical protein